MNVLVIGGNRFFGKKLVRKLLESNHGANKPQITLLNRQSLDDGFGSQVQRIKCDRSDAAAMRAALATTSWDLVYDQVCYQARDARAACELFADKTSHYIFTSTQSVYEPGVDLTEDAFDPAVYRFAADTDFYPGTSSKNDYAEAKRQCESIFFAQDKFSVTAVRFTFVVGEDDYTNRLKWHINRVKSGEPIYFPNIEAKIPLIHSDDAAEVLLALGEKRIAGVFNASSPNPLRLAELIAYIERALGKTAILTNEKSDFAHSPYGVEADWYMSVEKLNRHGVFPRESSAWLPDLLSLYTASVRWEDSSKN